MKNINLLEVTAIILAEALGKSIETAQAEMRKIRTLAGKTVGHGFVTVPDVAKYYNTPLDETYRWLKMIPV